MKKFVVFLIAAVVVVIVGIRAYRPKVEAFDPANAKAKSEADAQAKQKAKADAKAQAENDWIVRAEKIETDKAKAILAEKEKVVKAKAEARIVMDQILDSYGYQDLKDTFHKDLAETNLFDLESVALVKTMQRQLQGLDGDEAAKIVDRSNLIFGFGVKREVARRLKEKALLARQKPVWERREAEMAKAPPMRHLPQVKGRLAFSPDSKLLATLGDRTLTVWNLQTEKQIFRVESDGYNGALAFSPDGKHLAAGAHNGVLRVYDLTGRLVYQPDKKIGRTLDVTYVKWFGDLLVAAGMKDEIVVVRWSDKQEILRWDPVAYGPEVLDLKVRGDAVTELLIRASHCDVRAYPQKKGQQDDVVRVTDRVYDYHPATRAGLWKDKNGFFVRKDGNVTSRFRLEDGFWHHLLSPKGDQIVAWDLWDARVYLYNLEGREVLQVRYGHDLGVRYGDRSGDSVGSVAVSPDGKLLAVSGRAGLKIWTIPVQK